MFPPAPLSLVLPLSTGELSSDDDFYMLDSGLVVLQTTNDILNASLYDALDHRTVVSWQRVRGSGINRRALSYAHISVSTLLQC